MLCELQEAGNRTVVRLIGAVHFDEVEQFRQLLAPHITGGKEVLVDVSRCDSLCSMAVGLLLGFKIQSKHTGGDLKLTGASVTLRQLLAEVQGTDLIVADLPQE